MIKKNVATIDFNIKTFTLQVLYTILTTEIKKYQAALKKVKIIIKNSVAYNH